MRIAQRMVSRNYLNSLNTTMSKRADILSRGTTGLKFDRLSDNVADGIRAMRTQETRMQTEAQLDTVESILLEYNSVDSNLDSIDSVLRSMQEKVLKAMNDPTGNVSREVLAGEIISARDQILQFVNTKFGDTYLFGEQNNAGAAVSFDSTGKLTFNGVAVDSIYKDNGAYYYDDPSNTPPKTLVPDSGSVYLDIGLGLKMNNGEPDPRTAFKYSFSALDVMGFGAPDANGDPNNVYDCMTKLADAVKSGDHEAMSSLHTKFVGLNDEMRMVRTDLGTRMNFLDRTKDRLTQDIDNLSAMESQLISSDIATDSIDMKNTEYTWLAVLQLGSKIIPSSLLDYLR